MDEKSAAKNILLEALVVAVLGIALAFAVNALSPRGLKLSQNYFPGGPRPLPALSPPSNLAHGASASNAPSAFDLLAAHFQAEGLLLTDSNQVTRLFHDPRRQQDLVVFIDARKDDDYQKGHIPGAWQFDHYHPENYLPTVDPVCQAAQQIVVYCGGGECVDSESAAIFLRDVLRLPKEKLLVYGGGFHEWTANGLPIEEGVRQSGKLREAKP